MTLVILFFCYWVVNCWSFGVDCDFVAVLVLCSFCCSDFKVRLVVGVATCSVGLTCFRLMLLWLRCCYWQLRPVLRLVCCDKRKCWSLHEQKIRMKENVFKNQGVGGVDNFGHQFRGTDPFWMRLYLLTIEVVLLSIQVSLLTARRFLLTGEPQAEKTKPNFRTGWTISKKDQTQFPNGRNP